VGVGRAHYARIRIRIRADVHVSFDLLPADQ